MDDEAYKENNMVLTPMTSGRSMKNISLQNVWNILSPPTTNWFQEELEVVPLRLQNLNMEKEKTNKLFEEPDLFINEKEVELQLKADVQEKIQLELKKVHKLKGFNPDHGNYFQVLFSPNLF